MPNPARQKPNQKIVVMFCIGFACWFVLNKGYWLVAWWLIAPVASQMGPSGDVIVLFAYILLALINIIALVIFLVVRAWRWMAVGFGTAYVVNAIASFAIRVIVQGN